MITTQIESFAQCATELARLFPTHWEELALFKDRMPLSPQFQEYARREQEGKLFLATVRWNSDIVGYYTCQVAPGFHYSTTLSAHMDMLYIVPEVREKGLSLPLFRLVEKELRRRNAQVWYSGYKAHNPLGMPALLKVLDFQPADVYHVKWIGE